MKTAILLVALILVTSGCKTLFTPVVTQTPVQKPAEVKTIYITNTPPPIVTTNVVKGETVYVTNTPPSVVTPVTFTNPPVTVNITMTNGWQVNPAITSGIETAKTANAALNPTPSEPLVNWGLTGLSALLGVAAAWKNKRANALQTTLETVIKGVETAPTGVGLDGVKDSIAKVAALTGVSSELDGHVQRVSSKLAAYLDDGKLTAEELVDLANDATVAITDVPSQYRSAIAKLRA
jgi:hypothetical protein